MQVPESGDHEARVEFTRWLVGALDSWGATAEEQIGLLGLPPDTKPRALSRYRHDTPLPDEPEIRERAEHFAGIAEALRTSYPHNINGGRIWMNQPHRLFDQRTPLECMIKDGLNGVMAVRAYLDCAWDWHQSGSRSSAG